MPKLPVISGDELVKALRKMGFQVVSQKGSHVKLAKVLDNGKITCVVPLHDTLKIGTLSGILSQAKVSVEELLKYL